MQRGGLTSSTLPYGPPLPNNNCLSLVSSINSKAFSFDGSPLWRISMPISSPFPRTAPTKSDFTFCRPERRQLPTFSAFSCNFSELMVLMTAMPSLVCMCPAAKVLNQACLITDAISLRVTTADNALPFPNAEPMVMMSGTWSCHLNPQDSFPILPRPVLDSSQMVTALRPLKCSATPLRKPGAGMLTPPLACSGSQTRVPGLLADVVFTMSLIYLSDSSPFALGKASRTQSSRST